MNNFRLCAFADEAGSDLNVQIKAMKDNSISLLEARGGDGKVTTDFCADDAVELKKRLEAEGLNVWSIGSFIGKIGICDEFAPHLDKFKRVLEAAEKSGAQCLRIFSFYIPNGSNPDDYKDEVLERLSAFCDAAKGSPVAVCHENEKGIFGDNALRCKQIHEALPSLKAVFDPANFIQCGQDTLEAWKLLSQYVKYMHIKDCLADGTVVPAGKGIGNIKELLKMYGDKGKLVIENGVLKLWTLPVPERKFCFTNDWGDLPSPEYSEFPQTENDSAHIGILQNFANAILFGEELIAPGCDGINELTISNAAYLSSWKNNCRVDLPFDCDEFESHLNALRKNEISSSENNGFKNPEGKYSSRWKVNW